MATVTLFGGTGLVGSNILTTLLDTGLFPKVQTISRRPPKCGEHPKLIAVVNADNTTWAAALSSTTPPPTTVMSALGTMLSQAGSLAAQRAIDRDLNITLAEAARAAGVHTFVFVSSAGTRGALNSLWPYAQWKCAVEDRIRALGFPQAIILRPGAILGERETKQTIGGPMMSGLHRALGWVSPAWADGIGQDARLIARAAVNAVRLAGEGKAPGAYWVVEQKEVCRLGREEWWTTGE